jgi:hypothetical protein
MPGTVETLKDDKDVRAYKNFLSLFNDISHEMIINNEQKHDKSIFSLYFD